MKLKKADISMNTIVYAVIAVLVLLVMVIIFSKGVGKPSKELNTMTGDSDIVGCKNFLLGRTCLPANTGCTDKYPTEVTILDPHCKTGEVCCQTETGK